MLRRPRSRSGGLAVVPARGPLPEYLVLFVDLETGLLEMLNYPPG
jgi:hypothetical protein